MNFPHPLIEGCDIPLQDNGFGVDGSPTIRSMSRQPESRLTWRQARLLDWLRAPQHADLPQSPAISWPSAWWTVSDLVRLSNVSEAYTAAMCRHDLVALRSHGLAKNWPPRWQVGGES